MEDWFPLDMGCLPEGNIYIYIPTLVIQRSELDNHHAINGEIILKKKNIYFNGRFSIAMINNQRVYTNGVLCDINGILMGI